MYSKTKEKKINYPVGYIKNNKNTLSLVEKNINNNYHYLFVGSVGSGKTHLAKILQKTDDRFKFVYARNIYYEYVRLLKGDYADANERIASLVRTGRTRCLIFDDIGTEKPPTAAARSFIEGLIEDRYMAIEEGIAQKTIMTTNLSLKEIEMLYGERVADRILGSLTICKFQDISFRKKKMKVVSQ